MRPYQYRFVVQGTGIFPVDMLRYDAAYPFGSDDARKLLGTGNRMVTLRSGVKPTMARWKSFGWVVVSVIATKGAKK